MAANAPSLTHASRHAGGADTPTSVVASGLTGATAASRYVGATTGGAPASGTFAVGDFILDQLGVMWACTVAGSPGTWVPQVNNPAQAQNLLAWNFDPDGCTSSAIQISAGTMYMHKVAIPYTMTVTGLALGIGTAATATANQNFVMLFSSTGTRLAISTVAVMDSIINSTSSQARVPFSGTVSVPGGPGQFVWASFYMNGTMPFLTRGNPGPANEVTAAPYRHGRTSATFTTTPPTSQSPATGTVTTAPHFVGIY